MKKLSLSKKEKKEIDGLVEVFEANKELIRTFSSMLLSALSESTKLSKLTHSMKHRIKDPDHLRDKLGRKYLESKEKGKSFSINKDNLLTKINDLVGFRILHLHTDQIRDIDEVLNEILDQLSYKIIEKPFARTWDDETREIFKSCGIKIQKSPSMYTSVHYLVESNSKITLTCEIQVRTLMEEVWGEVDHQINYPYPTNHLPSSEQLKVLARVTSSATRLVDSIFRCIKDFEKTQSKS